MLILYKLNRIASYFTNVLLQEYKKCPLILGDDKNRHGRYLIRNNQNKFTSFLNGILIWKAISGFLLETFLHLKLSHSNELIYELPPLVYETVKPIILVNND